MRMGCSEKKLEEYVRGGGVHLEESSKWFLIDWENGLFAQPNIKVHEDVHGADVNA